MTIVLNKIAVIEALKLGKLTERHSANVETKASWSMDYGKKIAALANRVDIPIAWLVIGVEDSGALSKRDQNWVQNQEEVLSQHLNQFLNPSISVKTPECLEVNNSWIIIVEIHQPGVVVEWNKVAYKAIGSTAQPMSPEEILELTISLPGLIDYSAKKWKGNFDGAQVQAFAEIVGNARTESMLKSLSKLSPDEILERLKIKETNTARILFGDCKFRAVFYDIDGKPIENKTHEGLFRILNSDFYDAIQRWTKRIAPTGASESSLSISAGGTYSPLALREALANAVAHAAYYENDGEILIEVYTNKLIVSNLCMPELTIFANKWFSRSHKSSNKLLMEILRIAGYVDEVGRGKGVIYSEVIKIGEKPPLVEIEEAGRCKRWKLFLYGGVKSEVQIRLFRKLIELYKDEHEALVANALILWRKEPVSNIRNYIDGESKKIFEKILNDINGPIFYYQKNDEIVLHRWVRVLLEEGQDSKAFTPAEKEGLRKFAEDFCLKFYEGIITPKVLRDLAHLRETPSEKNLTSRLLKEWEKEKYIVRIKHGVYKFNKHEPESRNLLNLILS